jgi:hypothetical protein
LVRHDDVVTGREAINTGTDCLDDPGAFVAKHER